MRINACELMNEAKKTPAAYEGKQYKVTIGGIVTFLGKEAKTFEIWHGAFSLDKTGSTRLYVSDNTEVEEVQQPIPFLEAVKAYSEGKTIRCEKNGHVLEYKPFYGMLKLKTGQAVTAAQILEGNWYAEDSNE